MEYIATKIMQIAEAIFDKGRIEKYSEIRNRLEKEAEAIRAKKNAWQSLSIETQTGHR